MKLSFYSRFAALVGASLLSVGAYGCSSGNHAPSAVIGHIEGTITAGKPVTLDGSKSTDEDGDKLTYAWAIKSAPKGSTVTKLEKADTTAPAFTPDLEGDYVVALVVN